ncbi:penicillin-binding protein activator [Plastoroseomonas hellenica]|uniref:penicillin-binding protein activator n=1 Tax=Plastoroseomonas hellenica TaxID=2687306 RepID=UPI003462DFC1
MRPLSLLTQLRPMRRSLALLALVALAACGGQPRPGPQTGFAFQAQPEPPRTRVALLLPLSGQQAALGRAMQQAAELALFENGNPGVDFVLQDTRGTTGGAAEAARSAISDGARIIVGPLTAAEASAVSVSARSARVPVLAFTNDAAQGGAGIWTMGVTPAQQVRRVVGAAASAGARRIGLGARDDAFGRALAQALREVANELSLPPPTIALHPARNEPGAAARELAATVGPEGLDAVIIGYAGPAARVYAAGLVAGGLPVPPLRILGHALWAQDGGLANEAALQGATFAAPDPRARSRFEQRFESAFGQRPPRLAGVAYDAAGIAARAVVSNNGDVAGGDVFAGADGPIRLMQDGTALRGLALFRMEPSGDATVIDPAPMPGAAGF